MKVRKIFTLTRIFCLVGMIAWGHSIFAQNEDALRTDTVAEEQGTRQSPKAFVMGQISSNSILPLMPQYLAMQESLKDLKMQYEAEAKKSESDFQRKFEEFMKGQKDFPKTILEKRQNELQMMLETNADFRIKAQQLLAEAESGMLADVKAELQEAVSAVAQQKGVSIVYDLDGGSVPYIMPGLAIDLTSAVMQHLGIGATE